MDNITNLETLYNHIRTSPGHLCDIADRMYLPFGLVVDTSEGKKFFLNKYKGKFNKIRALARERCKNAKNRKRLA